MHIKILIAILNSLHVAARGKVICFVCCLSLVLAQKLSDLEFLVLKQIVSTTKLSKQQICLYLLQISLEMLQILHFDEYTY